MRDDDIPTGAEKTQSPGALPMLRSFELLVRDFAGGSRAIGARAALFTLFAALTEGVGLMLLLPLVNIVSRTKFGSGVIDRAAASAVALLPAGSATIQLAYLLTGFAALMTIRAWAILNRDVLIAKLQTGFVDGLRDRVVTVLAQADWRVLTQLRHGRIAHVLSNDIRSCGMAAQLTLQSTIAAVVLAVQMTLALFLSPMVALIVFAMLAVGAVSLRPSLRRSRQLGTELTEASFRLTDDTNQFLGGLKLAFSQNLQGSFADKFRRTVIYGSHREIAFARQRAVGQIALTSLAAATAGVALLLGFGVFGTSPSALIALLIVLGRMSGPAAQIQQNLQYVVHSLPAYEQIRSLEHDLAMATGDRWSHPSRRDELPSGDVVLSGVSFSYGKPGDGASNLVDIDLELHGGEIVGITGPSGAGKTTLVDLLVGLLVPDQGSISVGGRRLDDSTIQAWRDRISYVSQDPFLFNDSIAGNLRWARPDASDDELRQALALAGADTLVSRLPQGLDTPVGERGSRLSGGERQRVALARALIRNPALIILDEATNAIDVAAERTILERLAMLTPRPTLLMVAHRDQSLALCERLITLEAGRLTATERTSAAGRAGSTVV